MTLVLLLGVQCPSAWAITPASPLSANVKQVWNGVTVDSFSIPSSGQANPYLKDVDLSHEPLGNLIDVDGMGTASGDFVSGKVSWFGGPQDTGVTSTETGAITGQRLRALNPETYYAAMRFNYGNESDNGVEFWRKAKLLVVNPATGKSVVVQPVDWGPDPTTGRLIDMSPGALLALGLDTNGTAWVSFADPDAELGPVK